MKIKPTDINGIIAITGGGTGATTAAGARTSLAPLASPGFIYPHKRRLRLSAAGSTATFGIEAGQCSDSTVSATMVLGSAYTKTASAWAAGSGNGSLDTGAVAANTWYHVWLIAKADLSATDVLISTSVSAPTMPATYTLKRRIGSIKTNGSSQWYKFSMVNDNTFVWDAPKTDISSVVVGTTANTLRTLASVPPGIVTTMTGNFAAFDLTQRVAGILYNPASPTQGAGTPGFNYNFLSSGAGQTAGQLYSVQTNTAQQIGTAFDGVNVNLTVNTVQWTDPMED